MRRQVKRGGISPQDGERWIGVLARLPVLRHPHLPYLARVWELRANISAYDASYVALAESLDAPLLTRDARLARSSGHTARIAFIA